MSDPTTVRETLAAALTPEAIEQHVNEGFGVRDSIEEAATESAAEAALQGWIYTREALIDRLVPVVAALAERPTCATCRFVQRNDFNLPMPQGGQRFYCDRLRTSVPETAFGCSLHEGQK